MWEPSEARNSWSFLMWPRANRRVTEHFRGVEGALQRAARSANGERGRFGARPFYSPFTQAGPPGADQQRRLPSLPIA